jgi:hypothetical protein
MLPTTSTIVLIFVLFPLAFAQFNFFDQMFGHQQQPQRPSGASQWNAQSESGMY